MSPVRYLNRKENERTPRGALRAVLQNHWFFAVEEVEGPDPLRQVRLELIKGFARSPPCMGRYQ